MLRSCLHINLAALVNELAGSFFQSVSQRFLFGDALLGCVFPHVFDDLYGARVRFILLSDHSFFALASSRACTFAHSRPLWRMGSAAPAASAWRPFALRNPSRRFPSGSNQSVPAQGVVAVLRAGMAFRQVGGVRGDLVGDDAVFHVFLVRRAEVFLGGVTLKGVPGK